MKNNFKNLILLIAITLSASNAFAQTTAFTYQGKLVDGAASPTGQYDFIFRIFGTNLGGSPIAATTVDNLPVTAGIFTAALDFGNAPFPANSLRWLEISVRPGASTGAYTILLPRQSIGTAPYAMNSIASQFAEQSLNSSTLGGFGAGNFVQTNDARLTDARVPLPNSPNYVQNTTTQQPSVNLNIGGSATVGGTISGNVVTTATQYNIGGLRMLSAPGAFNTFIGGNAGRDNTTGGNNIFAGYSAGVINTTGEKNSFYGVNAGQQNLTGSNNSFFGEFSGFYNSAGSNNAFFGQGAGRFNNASDNSFFGTFAGADNFSGSFNSFFGKEAGRFNGTGAGNSFFGFQAGFSNTIALSNSFFGNQSGRANTDGGSNSFYGDSSGLTTTNGSQNSFFGYASGINNRTGGDNSFFGRAAGAGNFSGNANTLIGTNAGDTNTIGSNNTIIGNKADLGDYNLTNATAIGANAQVSRSNSLVLGSISGFNQATANTNVGIGTNAPTFKLEVVDSSNTGLRVQNNTEGGTVASFGEKGEFQIDAPLGNFGGRFIVLENGNVGINTNNPRNKLDVFGIVAIGGLGSAGGTPLCRNSLLQISACSSSIRYKSNVENFNPGLNLIRRLRPVSFNWKADNQADLGLVAEEVAAVEPLLTTQNDKGEIEGVKYDRVGVVLVNAVNEQQTQIEAQQNQIKEQQEQLNRQQAEIEALKKFICSNNPTAEICQPKIQPFQNEK